MCTVVFFIYFLFFLSNWCSAKCCPITEPVMKEIVIILAILWRYSGETGVLRILIINEYWSTGLTQTLTRTHNQGTECGVFIYILPSE